MSSKEYPPTVEELKEFPAPADPDEVAAIARQFFMGQTLEEALNEMVAEDARAEEGQTGEDEEEASSERKRTLWLKQHMADNVMLEFGRTVARTNWTPQDGDPVAPQPALIRGRLDHYNRFNGKWRIVVKKAQFKRRATLDKNRKKVNPLPLWDAVKTQASKDSISLQILAYDDL